MSLQTNQTRVPGLASVIVPSYNKAPYIRATLDSIADQTYGDIEIVVVDDASSDESVEVVRAWAAAHPTPLTLLEHEENLGVCRTLNDGLAFAKGEYISCLAADDRYLPHKIASHVQLLTDNPRASFAYGDTRIEDPEGRILQESFTYAYQQGRFRQGDIFLDLLTANFIAALTVTMRASALDEVGPYDESLPYEDYDMWLRLSRVGGVVSSETIDCVYLETPRSLSKTLGQQLDIGHLMILSKYRHAPGVNRRRLDDLAVRYARKAARNGPSGENYFRRIEDLTRIASIYGSLSFALRSVAEELGGTDSAAQVRLRNAAARVKRLDPRRNRP